MFRKAFGSLRRLSNSGRLRRIVQEISCEKVVEEEPQNGQYDKSDTGDGESRDAIVENLSSESHIGTQQIENGHPSNSGEPVADFGEADIHTGPIHNNEAAKELQHSTEIHGTTADTDKSGSIQPQDLIAKSKRKAPEGHDSCLPPSTELDYSPQPRKKISRRTSSVPSFDERGNSDVDLLSQRSSTVIVELEPSENLPSHPIPECKALKHEKESSTSNSDTSRGSQRRKSIFRRMSVVSISSESSESDTDDSCSRLSTSKRKTQPHQTRTMLLDVEKTYDSPSRTGLTRDMSRWSIGSYRASFDRINVSSPSPEVNIFRYFDLPPELQDIILEFTFEPDNASSFPSYDYLIPDQDASHSELFVKGYRLWLTPHVKIRQFAVSHQFLKDAIRVLGKLAPIEVHTKRMAQKSRGGLVLNDKPMRRYTHPKQDYGKNITQEILTDLLAASSQVRFKMWSAIMPHEILDQLKPLMPALKQIEASLPLSVAWIRSHGDRQFPYGYLIWQGLSSIGLRSLDELFKLIVLTEEELNALRTDKKLPEGLRYLFENDSGLNRYSTEIEKYNKGLLDSKNMSEKSGEDANGGEEQVTRMSLSFNVEALLFNPKPDHDPYRTADIFMRFDDERYCVTHVDVRDIGKVQM